MRRQPSAGSTRCGWPGGKDHSPEAARPPSGATAYSAAMATHEIRVKLPAALEVINRDVEIIVKIDGQTAGRLKVSRGEIEWVPRGNHTNSYTLGWGRLAAPWSSTAGRSAGPRTRIS